MSLNDGINKRRNRPLRPLVCLGRYGDVAIAGIRLRNGRDETITPARERLDIAWFFGVIAKGGTNFLNGEIETLLKIHKGFFAPDLLVDFLASYKRTWPACE